MKNLRLYELLGIDGAADQIAMRRALKKLSDPLLPEKDPPIADAAARLKALRAAYDVLADPESRASYDEFGEAALKPGFDLREARRQRTRDEERAVRQRRAALAAPTAIERPELAPDGTKLKRDWAIRVAIGLGHARRGGLLRFPLTRPVACSRCEGSGRQDRACKSCDGGKTLIYTKHTPCIPCHGVGLMPGEKVRCRKCRGNGYRGKSACWMCGGCGLVLKRVDCGACAGRGLKIYKETLPCGGCSGTGLKACLRCVGAGKLQQSRMFKLYVPRHVRENTEYRYAGAGFSTRDDGADDLYVVFAIVAGSRRG